MAKLHNISDPGKIHQNVIFRFDILFGSPPIGVSSIQGNIFQNWLIKISLIILKKFLGLNYVIKDN